VRRLEATTGEGALKLIQSQQALLNQAAGELKSPVHELPAKIVQDFRNAKVA